MLNSKQSVREALLETRYEDATGVAESTPLIKAASYDAPKAAAPPPPSAFDDAKQHESCCAAGFSTGLFDCCAGPQACQIFLMSQFLPCFAHGIIADEASGGKSSQKTPCALYTFGWTGLACLMKTPFVSTTALGTLARGKLRSKYGLHEDGCADCCTHMWCHPCAMAQEIRHIRDERAAAITTPAGGHTNVAPKTVEKMQLVSWEPVESKDKVASLTAAYL